MKFIVILTDFLHRCSCFHHRSDHCCHRSCRCSYFHLRNCFQIRMSRGCYRTDYYFRFCSHFRHCCFRRYYFRLLRCQFHCHWSCWRNCCHRCSSCVRSRLRSCWLSCCYCYHCWSCCCYYCCHFRHSRSYHCWILHLSFHQSCRGCCCATVRHCYSHRRRYQIQGTGDLNRIFELPSRSSTTFDSPLKFVRLFLCPRPIPRSLLKPPPKPPPPPLLRGPFPFPFPFPFPPPPPPLLKIVDRRHSLEELRKISMYLRKKREKSSEKRRRKSTKALE